MIEQYYDDIYDQYIIYGNEKTAKMMIKKLSRIDRYDFVIYIRNEYSEMTSNKFVKWIILNDFK